MSYVCFPLSSDISDYGMTLASNMSPVFSSSPVSGNCIQKHQHTPLFPEFLVSKNSKLEASVAYRKISEFVKIFEASIPEGS